MMMYERAVKGFAERIRICGLDPNGDYPDRPKRPDRAIKIKRMAIAKLERERPTPTDIWPKV